MKSTVLKAVKMVALSLVLTVGASSLVFANGGGASTARKKSKTHRVARRHTKPKSKTA